MKKIRNILIACVLLLALGLGATIYYIDHIARVAIELGASYALGVPTTLQSLSIKLLRGRADLQTLAVANPPGYQSTRFFGIASARGEVSLSSLSSDMVDIPELRLAGIDLALERNKGASNYQAILDNLKRFEQQISSQSSPGSTKEGKRFVIRLITIENVAVSAQVQTLLAAQARVDFKIDRIELRNVGSNSDKGVLLNELTGVIVEAILAGVLRNGGGLLPPEIANDLNVGLAQLRGVGQNALAAVGEVTTVVGGQVKKLGDLSTETLKGLRDGTLKLGQASTQGVKAMDDGLKAVGDKMNADLKKTGEGIGKGLQGLIPPKPGAKPAASQKTVP